MKKGIVVNVHNEKVIDGETYVFYPADFLGVGTRKTTVYLKNDDDTYEERTYCFSDKSNPTEFLKIGDIIGIDNGEILRGGNVYSNYSSWIGKVCDDYVMHKAQSIKDLSLEERIIAKDDLEQFRNAILLGRYLNSNECQKKK